MAAPRYSDTLVRAGHTVPHCVVDMMTRCDTDEQCVTWCESRKSGRVNTAQQHQSDSSNVCNLTTLIPALSRHLNLLMMLTNTSIDL